MIVPKDQEIQALLGHSDFKSPNLYCGRGHKIERFCSNQACNYDSFCCNDDLCNLCEGQHQFCSFKKLRQLDKVIQDRLFLHSKILRKLFKIENQLINKLISGRKNIIDKEKVWKFGNCAKTIDSIYFKDSIKGLKGKQMKELFGQLSQNNNIEQQADQYLSFYKEEKEKMMTSLENLRNQLIENLGKSKKGKEYDLETKNRQKTQIQSKILVNDSQGREKYSFLMKQLNNPPKLKLIFRASQHNFAASKFHQCCDGISDTVTIVRTEFGKTIAAYTPLKWSSVQGYVADESKRSFLLQLQLKQKMTLIHPQKAICNNKNYGPVFGRDHDLCINDKCNLNQSSFSYFPSSYNFHGKYNKNQESHAAFCGNPISFYFRVIQYQVFVVCK